MDTITSIDRLQTNALVGTISSTLHHATIANHVAFVHASRFSPPLSTWCDAIDADHLTTWSGLTLTQVRNHLP
jgi:hypothetical protein